MVNAPMDMNTYSTIIPFEETAVFVKSPQNPNQTKYDIMNDKTGLRYMLK